MIGRTPPAIRPSSAAWPSIRHLVGGIAAVGPVADDLVAVRAGTSSTGTQSTLMPRAARSWASRRALRRVTSRGGSAGRWWRAAHRPVQADNGFSAAGPSRRTRPLSWSIRICGVRGGRRRLRLGTRAAQLVRRLDIAFEDDEAPGLDVAEEGALGYPQLLAGAAAEMLVGHVGSTLGFDHATLGRPPSARRRSLGLSAWVTKPADQACDEVSCRPFRPPPGRPTVFLAGHGAPARPGAVSPQPLSGQNAADERGPPICTQGRCRRGAEGGRPQVGGLCAIAAAGAGF